MSSSGERGGLKTGKEGQESLNLNAVNQVDGMSQSMKKSNENVAGRVPNKAHISQLRLTL